MDTPATNNLAVDPFVNKHWLSDNEIQALGVPSLEEEGYRRYHSQQSYGLDTCYDILRPHTFPTSFLPLSHIEIQSLVTNFSPVYKKFTEDSARALVRNSTVLSSLAQRVDEALRGLEGNAAFVKLNTRSPKDVVFDDFDKRHVRKVIQSVESDLADVKAEYAEEDGQGECVPKASATDLVLTAFNRALLRLLKATDGEGAIALLIRSRRVNEDLVNALNFSKYNSSTNDDMQATSLALRSWSPALHRRTQLEFRAFIYQSSFNALTAYDSLTYIPTIARHHVAIPAEIQTFWSNHLREPLAATHDSYVADFLWDPPSKVWIIELNRFCTGAGACLFSWGKDQETLMRGPVQFRYVEKPGDGDELLARFPLVWQNELRCLVEREEGKRGFIASLKKIVTRH